MFPTIAWAGPPLSPNQLVPPHLILHCLFKTPIKHAVRGELSQTHKTFCFFAFFCYNVYKGKVWKKGMMTVEKANQYLSLGTIARQFSEQQPSYVVQSWLRDRGTLEFLMLWEQENNPEFDIRAYQELLERTRESGFTLTPKHWLERTGAIGITSKQGKTGGTYAHPDIACEFMTWLSPKFRLIMIQSYHLAESPVNGVWNNE